MTDFLTLSSSIYAEFTDAMDYIWKSPKLIESETKDEIEKLKFYFPDDPENAKIRWHFESKRLDQVFPYLNSIGNLFGIMSLFEAYLMRLSKILEQTTGNAISQTKGSGTDRLIKYLRSQDIKVEEIDLYPQIIAGVKIRNCLFHATGLLEWSKDSQEIRRIQKSATYLSSDHRLRRNNSEREDEVKIVNHAFGDRLQINNTYAWVLAYYLREFLGEVCNLIEQKSDGGGT